MNHKTTIPFIFCFLLVFSSCNYSDDYVVVKKEKEFQIAVPGWIKSEKLADDVLLSYANRYRNFYLVVSKNQEKISFDSFNIQCINRIQNSMDSAVTSSVINNQSNPTFYRNDIYGKMGDEKERIYYSQKVVNGSKNFYQISVWTRGVDRKLKYQIDIDSILNSFKEL